MLEANAKNSEHSMQCVLWLLIHKHVTFYPPTAVPSLFVLCRQWEVVCADDEGLIIVDTYDRNLIVAMDWTEVG